MRFDLLCGEGVQGGEVHIGLIDRFQPVMEGFGLAQLFQGLIHEGGKRRRAVAGSGFQLDMLAAGQLPAAVNKGQAAVRQQNSGESDRVQGVGGENEPGAPGLGLPKHQLQGSGSAGIKNVDKFT